MHSAFDIRTALYKSLIIFTALGLLLVVSYAAAHAEDSAITASYLYDLTGLGTDGQFDNPRDVFVDRQQDEVFVADNRHHRIKIFNTNGMMLYQFGSEKSMRVPSAVSVDSRGIIYVLHGYRGAQQVSAYNYRGVFLKSVSYEDLPQDEPVVTPTGIAVDSADRLYVLDEHGPIKRMLVLGPEGDFIKSFRIMTNLDEKVSKESFCGKPYIAQDGNIYVPNPMLGTVYAYSPDGEFLRTIGTKGSVPGKLTFPADVAEDSQRHILVLDSMRHNVVVYDREGTFIAEFGGFGYSDGWFYSPLSIALDSEDRAYIAQVVNDRVQVVQLHGLKDTGSQVSMKKSETKGGEIQATTRGPNDT
jgi:DNA-binding beta-propeller fold protein YncE